MSVDSGPFRLGDVGGTGPPCSVYTASPGPSARVSSARRQVHSLSRSAHVVTVDWEGRELACQALDFLSELEARTAG